jgi:hypothetical protein
MISLGFFQTESDAATVFGGLISFVGIVATVLGGTLLDRTTADVRQRARDDKCRAEEERANRHQDEFLLQSKMRLSEVYSDVNISRPSLIRSAGGSEQSSLDYSTYSDTATTRSHSQGQISQRSSFLDGAGMPTSSLGNRIRVNTPEEISDNSKRSGGDGGSGGPAAPQQSTQKPQVHQKRRSSETLSTLEADGDSDNVNMNVNVNGKASSSERDRRGSASSGSAPEADSKEEGISSFSNVATSSSSTSNSHKHRSEDGDNRAAQEEETDSPATKQALLYRVFWLIFVASALGTLPLVLLYFVYSKFLYLACIGVGIGLLFVCNASLSLGVMIAVPDENRSLAVGLTGVMLHIFGDVPSPIIVGLLKDT